MSRNIKDADLIKSVAVAAAGASSSTASFDFGGAGVASLESVELLVELPILPALVDTETVTLTVEDSADNSSFAAVDCGNIVATGTETPGSLAALSQKFKLPSVTRRYVRVTGAVSASAGDNTGVSFTATILL